eukprot:c38156_g1_i1 orf=2-223(-)
MKHHHQVKTMMSQLNMRFFSIESKIKFLLHCSTYLLIHKENCYLLFHILITLTTIFTGDNSPVFIIKNLSLSLS